MNAIRFSLCAATLMLFLSGTQAQAYYPHYPNYSHPLIPQAPNTLGPGYYCVGCYGGVYGPNYCLRPPFQPFNGMIFPTCRFGPGGKPTFGAGGGQPPTFPTHPFARSPRDFFMVD